MIAIVHATSAPAVTCRAGALASCRGAEPAALLTTAFHGPALLALDLLRLRLAR
jgi:hypothetical protein